MEMEPSNIKDAFDFDGVAKTQKLFSEIVDSVRCEIEQALATIQSPHDPSTPVVDQKSILIELKSKLNAIGAPQQLEESHKELNTSIEKYQKLLENLLFDISKAYRKEVDFDSHIINQIIASHFYYHGLFELGDSIMKEAGETDAMAALRSQFLEMHQNTRAVKSKMQQIIQAMKDRNLEPALTWVSTKREKLTQIGSNLELEIHKLKFTQVLQNGTQVDAIHYAETYLAPYASLYKDEIQHLMGGLLYVGRLENSPYSELMSPHIWETTTEELSRVYNTFIERESYKDPLSVVIAAGAESLPTMLKMENVMQGLKQEWQQFPVPVDLGKEFQFHSIFVCPVTGEQGSEKNPQMLLPCSHVFRKQTIMELSKNNTQRFKCPICPRKAFLVDCKKLYF